MGAGFLCYVGRRKAGARAVFPALPITAMKAAGAFSENCLNYYSSPVCAHPVQARLNACPHPAPACIVLPRAAPQWGGRANPENRILRKTQEVRQTI